MVHDERGPRGLGVDHAAPQSAQEGSQQVESPAASRLGECNFRL